MLNGVLKYKGRIYVGNNEDLKNRLITELHNSALGGHYGYLATYMRIKNLFYWPGMKREIKAYVQECEVCQRCNEENTLSHGRCDRLPSQNRLGAAFLWTLLKVCQNPMGMM